MDRASDISSTEKLLQSIRSRKEEAAPVPPSVTPPRPKTGRRGIPRPGRAARNRPSTVGIEIRRDCLRLVRAEGSAAAQRRIIDWRSFPLPEETPRDAPGFAAFLRSSLEAACGSPKHSELWVMLAAEKTDVRHIRIPKVPRKQIPGVVYYTVKKEEPFDEKEMLLDFEILGEVDDKGIAKLAVTAYLAPLREIAEIKELFAGIGWPLAGITIPPFATQNLFRTGWIPGNGETLATLFIGRDHSQIDLFAAGNLLMTRDIKAGLSSMVEALVYRLNELRRYPALPPLTIEQGWKMLLSLSPDSPPLIETDPGFDLRKEEIFEMAQPALERLARQVARTFEHHLSTMPDDRIARVYVASAMNSYPPVIDYLGSQLGIACVTLDPLAEPEGAAAPAEEDLSASDRIAFGPALGLALSGDDHTPNLLFTYKDRQRETSIARINRGVFAAFVVAVLVLAGIFTYQNHTIAEKKRVLAGIEKQIAELGPSVGQERLLGMKAKAGQRQQLMRLYADRYLDVVLISELAALTPAGIRFVDLKIRRGPVLMAAASAPPKEDPSKEKGKEPPKAATGEVTVEGLILGERETLETTLAGYVMLLEASPHFRQVTIQSSSVEPYTKNETLHFILNLKVEAPAHG